MSSLAESGTKVKPRESRDAPTVAARPPSGSPPGRQLVGRVVKSEAPDGWLRIFSGALMPCLGCVSSFGGDGAGDPGSEGAGKMDSSAIDQETCGKSTDAWADAGRERMSPIGFADDGRVRRSNVAEPEYGRRHVDCVASGIPKMAPHTGLAATDAAPTDVTEAAEAGRVLASTPASSHP